MYFNNCKNRRHKNVERINKKCTRCYRGLGFLHLTVKGQSVELLKDLTIKL